MDDLVTWLRAQLDEDDRLITAYEAYMAESAAAAGSFMPVIPPGWQSGESFDPDRQRAEVDAKRRILDLMLPGRPVYPGAYGQAYRDVLRLLALPYADRPGYRADWKP